MERSVEKYHIKKMCHNLIGKFYSGIWIISCTLHLRCYRGWCTGGVLGMTLLLNHWLHISPAVSGFVMNAACYLLGWKLLGKEFIAYSALATVGFSGMYKICEQFPHLWPGLADMPLVAALVGALFVGVGAGLCVRVGGAPSGDDALAMSISHAAGWKIQWVYLLSDLIVLVMSLSYIPVRRIGYSLFTVLLSGQLIGFVQNFNRTQETGADCVTEN